MNGPQVVCFCGGNHVAGWCLRNDWGNHRFKSAAVDGYEVCIDCGKGRPVSSPNQATDARSGYVEEEK